MKDFLIWLHEQQEKPDIFTTSFVPYLKKHEGWRSSRYLDHKGHPTVGYGFLIDDSFEGTLSTVFPNKTPEWRRGVISGSGQMTEQEGTAILSHLARAKFDKTREMVGGERFDTMSPDLQTRLGSENYRGMLGKSPKTLKYIQTGDYDAAAKEYLNAREYRENMKNSVGTRMSELSDALRSEAKRIREAQQPLAN